MLRTHRSLTIAFRFRRRRLLYRPGAENRLRAAGSAFSRRAGSQDEPKKFPREPPGRANHPGLQLNPRSNYHLPKTGIRHPVPYILILLSPGPQPVRVIELRPADVTSPRSSAGHLHRCTHSSPDAPGLADRILAHHVVSELAMVMFTSIACRMPLPEQPILFLYNPIHLARDLHPFRLDAQQQVL